MNLETTDSTKPQKKRPWEIMHELSKKHEARSVEEEITRIYSEQHKTNSVEEDPWHKSIWAYREQHKAYSVEEDLWHESKRIYSEQHNDIWGDIHFHGARAWKSRRLQHLQHTLDMICRYGGVPEEDIDAQKELKMFGKLGEHQFYPLDVLMAGIRCGNLPFLKSYLSALARIEVEIYGVDKEPLTLEEKKKDLIRCDKFGPWEANVRVIEEAIQHSNTEVAKYLYDKDVLLGRDKVFVFTIRYGLLSLAQWANPDPIRLLDPTQVQDAVVSAAVHGHVHVLEWLRTQGVRVCPIIANWALQSGQIECAKWVYRYACPIEPLLGECKAECIGNHKECLKLCWALDDISTIICGLAVSGNSVECLRYLHEEVGYSLTHELFAFTVASRCTPCMEYLHTNKCPWTCDMVKSVISSKDTECIEWLGSRGYSIDACCGPPRCRSHSVVES